MKETIINWFKTIRRPTPRKRSRKQWAVFSLTMAIFVVAILFVFYYRTTGLCLLPFLNQPETVLPPTSDSNPTFSEVESFIKSDDTNTMPYGEGFNCFDAVLRIWRNAQWRGLQAYRIVIIYEKPPHHAVIGFQTIDNGDVFYETQTDQQIKLRIGADYGDKEVIGVYLIQMSLVPIYGSPEISEMPQFK